MNPKILLNFTNIVCFLLLNAFSASGQAMDKSPLFEQISKLNNSGAYDKTIVLLERVLLDPNATSYEKYDAYFLKYLTYKRLFNYEEATTNLNLALEQGLKSDKAKQIASQVKLERLFVVFDLLKFAEVEAILQTVSEEDLSYIDATSKAFYLSVKGTMTIRKNKYEQADLYYQQAIDLLMEAAPQHLPLIYRKRIDLYRKQGKHDKAIESFNLGLEYAKKYNIDTYILNMYYDITTYYVLIEDYEKAVAVQDICNRLIKEYDEGNVSGRLNVLEKQIQKQILEEQKQKDQILYFTLLALLLLLILVLFILFKFIAKARHNKLQNKIENNALRNHIVAVVIKSGNQLESTTHGENVSLSERQKEIIELVKQGKTNKEIGNLLFISENTVKYHLKNTYDLLNIRSRVEL